MPLIKTESGCKVAWYFYDNEEEALAASKKAKEEANRQLSLGYDFGYQSPGQISKQTDKNGNDVWIVVMP